jgi:beta-glucosidase
MEAFKLPEDLLLGTATSSLQIEGGDKNNNWYRYCEEGKVKDGSHCIVADDHWNRFEEDITLMKQLNLKVYRMSIEWSRIEPKRGVFDDSAVDHYRAELKQLHKENIRPLVTLHHFSNPIWFDDIGGWENPESVDYFKKYTQKAVTSFGDLVSEWVTINEPNVYLEGAYISANFPPQKQSTVAYFKVMKNMIKAHIEAYKLIHEIRSKNGYIGKTLVGIANHVRVFDTESKDILTKLACNLVEYNFHTICMEGMMHGKFKFPLGFGNYPLGKGEFYDFLGINYYSRDIIKFTWDLTRLFAAITVKEGAELNDMGWEIYPEGLYRVCRKYSKIYKKPIFITENGICDERDSKRSRFIYDHLKMVSKLRAEGVNVERYYYWSLLDNFEWEFGLTPKFGIIEVDYETKQRKIRRSGMLYGEISEKGEITKEMIKEYL